MHTNLETRPLTGKGLLTIRVVVVVPLERGEIVTFILVFVVVFVVAFVVAFVIVVLCRCSTSSTRQPSQLIKHALRSKEAQRNYGNERYCVLNKSIVVLKGSSLASCFQQTEILKEISKIANGEKHSMYMDRYLFYLIIIMYYLMHKMDGYVRTTRNGKLLYHNWHQNVNK